jgi:Glycosyl hydrolase catalytic core
MVRNLFVVSLITLLTAQCGAQVQETFFGIHAGANTFPLTIPAKSLRLWDTGTNWFQLCPDSDYSQCDWKRLDKFLAAAKNNGIVDVMYTFGKTPGWISTDPENNCWGRFKGVCFPPRDLTPDGGGSDAAFKGFVQAIVNHNQRLNPDAYLRIKYWGLWNEPNAGQFWRGTVPQMVRMTKDAREIIKAADPEALILTPEPSSTSRHNNINHAAEWLDQYLNAGGGQYVDVIAFHTYPNNAAEHPVVEDLVKMVNSVKAVVARHPEVSKKPLWVTEGSWQEGNETNWQSDDHPKAFVALYHILLASEGIERVYWYKYEGEGEGCCGTLWNEEHGDLPAASAYREVYNWLLGRTVSPCSSQGNIWFCDIAGPGFKGRIVWNSDYDQTATTSASGFTSYKDLGGAVSPIRKDGSVTAGNKPILLEQRGPTR